MVDRGGKLADALTEKQNKDLDSQGIDVPQDIGEGQEKVRIEELSNDAGTTPSKPKIPKIPGAKVRESGYDIWKIIAKEVWVGEANDEIWAEYRAINRLDGKYVTYTPFIYNRSYSVAIIKFYPPSWYSAEIPETNKIGFYSNEGITRIYLNGGPLTNVRELYTPKGEFVCKYYQFTKKTSRQGLNTLEVVMNKDAKGKIGCPSNFFLLIPYQEYYPGPLPKFSGSGDGSGGPGGPNGGGKSPENNYPPTNSEDSYRNLENVENLSNPAPLRDANSPTSFKDLKDLTGVGGSKDIGLDDKELGGGDNDLFNKGSDVDLSDDDKGVDIDQLQQYPQSEITLTLEGYHDIRVGDQIAHPKDPLRRRFIVTQVEFTYTTDRMYTQVTGSVDGSLGGWGLGVEAIINYMMNLR